MTKDTEFAAFVGIDWADQKHDAYTLSAAKVAPRHEEIRHTAESLAEWVADLRARYGGRPVAVCLEQRRGALIYTLMQYGFLTLFPINPKQLADYRDALYPSGPKGDVTDAELLARFLHDHIDKLRAWHPDDEATRGLRLLTELRRKWVHERVGLMNSLQHHLKETYPLALGLGNGNWDSEQFLALLEKFPTQRELQRASPKQLEKWLPKWRRMPDDPPAEELLRNRIAAIRKALPITTDRPIVEHARLAILHLVHSIRQLNESIDTCEQKLEEFFAMHPDRELFEVLPGAGKALAPRLAAAYGTDRTKFKDARDMQQLSGIAPITRASGKTKVVLVRFACPKFLRQTFHEFANASVRFSRWARAYRDMCQARGMDLQAIFRSLAYKWQRIIFRCWKDRKKYDEHRYIQRLRDKGSKIINFLPPDPA